MTMDIIFHLSDSKKLGNTLSGEANTALVWCQGSIIWYNLFEEEI